MLKIVTPMMEHICDNLCRFPGEIERKEDLEEVCANCQMDQYTNLILNQSDKINDYEKNSVCTSVEKLEIQRAKQEHSG